jgi:hypothetical protein
LPLPIYKKQPPIVRGNGADHVGGSDFVYGNSLVATQMPHMQHGVVLCLGLSRKITN